METLGLMARIQLVQGDVEAVKKDSTNPHFRSKYADINSYIAMLHPLLKLHKLIILQPVVYEGETFGVKTVLTCETGERFESFMPVPLDDNPQKVGSWITYARRYSIQALFFLSAEDDDAETVVRSTTVTTNGGPKQWNKPTPK